MLRFFQNTKRSLDSLLILITDLVADGLLFFFLLFRSRTSLSAEVLFLRKQLAFYEERQVQPRRLNDSARFSLIVWSRFLQLERGLANRQTRDADWLASQGLQVVLEREVASQSANVSPRTACAYWPPKPEGRGHRRASPQNWSTFVRNHSQNIVVCDFLVVVTTQFRTLYVFILMEAGARRIVH